MNQPHILVIDDEAAIRDLVGDILRDEGYEVTLAEHAQAARDARRSRRPDAILLDIWMPGTDGIALLREWHAHGDVGCPVVVMSGHGTIETAIEATRLGAYDFIEKPISLAKLLLTLKRALEGERLRLENQGLRKQTGSTLEPFGLSREMQSLKIQAEKIATHDAPILIRGEAGTGRETLARWIHARGRRQQGPLVRVCALDINDERGIAVICGSEPAGAVEYGLLDRAQGGVLLLDEVADFPRDAQRALAQVLEARAFTRVGSRTAVPLDCRVIATIPNDAEQLVKSGKLLDALFFQLNVLPLHVPPLRDRTEDVPTLLHFFVDYFSARDALPPRQFSPASLLRLRQYDWPGNARELRNLVQRLLILGGNREIDLAEVEAMLNPHSQQKLSPSDNTHELINLQQPLREARDQFERRYLTEQLKRAEGSVGKLAQLSGMERTHLYRKLRDLGVETKSTGTET